MTFIRKFVARAVTDPSLSARQIRVIASTPAQDRQGDIVEPSGIVLDNYKLNPIVLYQHDPATPVGTARVEIASARVEAVVTFAPEGLSAKADEVCALYKAEIVRGVSIGFKPIASEPLPGGGLRFTKWELLECSLVSVPANQEAVTIARSYRAGRKSASAQGDNGVDHLQAIVASLAGARHALKKAGAAHEQTLCSLGEMEAWAHLGIQHAKALQRAGVSAGEADDDDADVELADPVARRKAQLDRLNRADVGAAAARRPPTELGGAFLTQQVRSADQQRIWDLYR